MEPFGFSKEKASQALAKEGIDVLVVSTPVNVYYTTGIPVIHVAPNPILFVLYNQFPTLSLVRNDGEESLVAWITYQSTKKFSWVTDVDGIGSPKAAMENIAKKIEKWGLGGNTIGLESLMPRYQADFLKDRFPNAAFVDADQALLDMRQTKTEEEIERIKKSTEISEHAIQAMMEAVHEGITDNELLQVGKRDIVDQGAEGWDHMTMGIGASDPEAPGQGTEVKCGDICRFDVGSVWKGYISDMSRCIALGEIPAGAQDVVDFVTSVQEYYVDNMQPGVNAKELNAKAKEFAKAQKKGTCYATGHSIGLECEEFHLFSPMKVLDAPFEENMVLDIEVWSPFKGAGLLGVEDCYRITSSGCERLSTLDKHIAVK
ncbi:MAG TPA: Xaa-Pro peptidase family protein [Candidatus Lokiarchaeia archaeon]|nr:Xaa-Pro peptidase family protein [Candidatus Lokiarchaeia archaeon]